MQWDNAKFLDDQKIVISEPEATYALREAWKQIYNEYPSNKTLAIIWSQTCLETGRFKAGFHCYNWGNIKSKPSDGRFWTMYPCSEIINGRELKFVPPHDQCKFRAYKSLIDGAVDYLMFLQAPRYTKALGYLNDGNVTQYTTALSVAGYFTASLTKYLAGMTRLTDEFLHRATELLSWQPTLPPPPPVPQDLAPTQPVPPPPPLPSDIEEDNTATIDEETPNFKPDNTNMKYAGLLGAAAVILTFIVNLFHHC